MKRRNFLRDVLMTAAISLLPKILHPSMGEVEDEMVELTFSILFQPVCFYDEDRLTSYATIDEHAKWQEYTIKKRVHKSVLPIIEENINRLNNNHKEFS